MSAALKPSAPLLVKIGSLVVHYQEFTSPDGSHFDKNTIDAIESDPDVKAWFDEMNRLAFLPVKRSKKK